MDYNFPWEDNPPGYLDGLRDFVTLAPLRNFFKITVCENCGQKWNGNYAHKYFEYCYTCGHKIGYEPPSKTNLSGKVELTHKLARYTKRELDTYDISVLKEVNNE